MKFTQFSFKKGIFICALLCTAEQVVAVNYSIPPSPSNQQYILQSQDTLTVQAGATLNTSAQSLPAVGLLGGNTVTNYGTIYTSNATLIYAGVGSPGLMFINNFGVLTTNAPSSLPAIDLSGVTYNNVQINNNNNASSIQGPIYLPSSTNSTLNFFGGTFTGPIQKYAGPGIATLNIYSDMTIPNSIIQINNINILNAGTLVNVNGTVSGFNSFTINPATNVYLNNQTLSGNYINNYGNFVINNGTVLVNNIFSSGNITLQSGALNGTIFGSGYNTLTLQANYTNNGPITNVSTISVLAGTFTVANSITGYQNFYNQSTVNLSGGSLSGGITPAGNNSTINVNTGFTAAGSLGANNINITPGASLTTSYPLFGNVNVGTNGSLLLNNSAIGSINGVNGNLNNSGYLELTNLSYVSGNFNQSASGNLTTTLGTTPNLPYGRLIVGGTSSVGGSIDVILPPDGGVLIPNNASYNIVTSNGGLYLANPLTVNQPDSFVLSFNVTQPNSNTLTLVANRLLYPNINTNPIFDGVATALEQIRANRPNPGQITVLSLIDNTLTQQQFESALSQLVPITNGGALLTSLAISNLNFDKITNRLDSLRAGLDTFQTNNTSYVAGDFIPYTRTAGPFFFGNSLKQLRRDNFEGFTSTTGGVGVLVDRPISCYFKIGTGLSYAVSGVREDNRSGDNTNINSFQGLLYGRAEYHWPFVEAMVSLGQNTYRTKRNIDFLGLFASATYRAVQISGKVRGGVAIPIYSLEVTPLIWYTATRLNQRQYTETGARGANLTVIGNHLTVMESGYGVRLADISEPDNFYPEIHLMYLTYNKRPELQVTSVFTDGGPAFITRGAVPARNGYNIGGSITAMMSEGFFIIGAYDYVGRNKFNSNSISLKIRYLF